MSPFEGRVLVFAVSCTTIFATIDVSVAEAQDVPSVAKLEVELGPGTDACPNEEVVRRVFLEQLSTSAPSRTVHIRFDREGETYVARVDVNGRRRDLRSPDCAELSSSAAWVAALAASGSAHKPELESTAVVAIPDPVPVSVGPSSRGADRPSNGPIEALKHRRSFEIPITASIIVGGGYVPGLWPGVSIGSGIRGKWWSFEGETRVFPNRQVSVRTSTRNATVTISAVVGTLLPCLRWAPTALIGFEGCASFSLGGDIADARGVARPAATAQPVVYAGGRGAIELRPSRRLSFGLGGTFEGAPVTTQISLVDGLRYISAWDGSAIAGAASLETSILF